MRKHAPAFETGCQPFSGIFQSGGCGARTRNGFRRTIFPRWLLTNSRTHQHERKQ